MTDLHFQWDEKKNAANKRKHGVSFEEAVSVFSDENALLLADPGHSAQERRFVLLGISIKLRLLTVVHCVRGDGDTIRLISARRASGPERAQYETRNRR